jgi:hypothetical protein
MPSRECPDLILWRLEDDHVLVSLPHRDDLKKHQSRPWIPPGVLAWRTLDRDWSPLSLLPRAWGLAPPGTAVHVDDDDEDVTRQAAEAVWWQRRPRFTI